MFKLVVLVRRKPGLARDEFERYWMQVHAPMVRTRLPGLRKYVLNMTQPGRDGAVPDIDGVLELRFDNRESYEAAFASPLWLSNDRQSSSEHFLDLGHLVSFHTDEYVVPLDE